VRVPDGVPHLAYCFTPMRYVWDQTDEYLGHGLRRALATPLLSALRSFDRRTAGPASVTRFVAISQEVAGRIKRHYGREANVVAPPVDVSWIEVATAPADDFFLLVSGFVPYKRDDIALECFRRSGRRLIVVGAPSPVGAATGLGEPAALLPAARRRIRRNSVWMSPSCSALSLSMSFHERS